MSVSVVAHPLGWIVLGAAGYFTYRAGKKAGKKVEEDIAKTSLSDRVVKGAMKTVYRTQKGVSECLGKAKEKYGSMWAEARTEENATSS
ncbi:hypothetical protein [Desulfobacter postgatei]|jgi:hypothetical protein|uniref:hypothetical protein n=1 Tax=Desulfobacter postgatei TaxID=2293 RepID=UPI002A36A519|nr:hypothetical protein [Desulfobacter postgatei]MDX9965025.1 hypothetical protein [Desulfobacter postgatei]